MKRLLILLLLPCLVTVVLATPPLGPSQIVLECSITDAVPLSPPGPGKEFRGFFTEDQKTIRFFHGIYSIDQESLNALCHEDLSVISDWILAPDPLPLGETRKIFPYSPTQVQKAEQEKSFAIQHGFCKIPNIEKRGDWLKIDSFGVRAPYCTTPMLRSVFLSMFLPQRSYVSIIHWPFIAASHGVANYFFFSVFILIIILIIVTSIIIHTKNLTQRCFHLRLWDILPGVLALGFFGLVDGIALMVLFVWCRALYRYGNKRNIQH